KKINKTSLIFFINFSWYNHYSDYIYYMAKVKG
ncbi:unnamed protein product, partial [marine sediment metagenome]